LHLWLPIGIGLAIVILAALVRKRSGPQRRHLRNGAMLYVLYVLALGVSALASAASWTMALPSWTPSPSSSQFSSSSTYRRSSSSTACSSCCGSGIRRSFTTSASGPPTSSRSAGSYTGAA